MIWRLSRATPLGSCSATVSSVSRNGYRSFRTSSCFFRDTDAARPFAVGDTATPQLRAAFRIADESLSVHGPTIEAANDDTIAGAAEMRASSAAAADADFDTAEGGSHGHSVEDITEFPDAPASLLEAAPRAHVLAAPRNLHVASASARGYADGDIIPPSRMGELTLASTSTAHAHAASPLGGAVILRPSTAVGSGGGLAPPPPHYGGGGDGSALPLPLPGYAPTAPSLFHPWLGAAPWIGGQHLPFGTPSMLYPGMYPPSLHGPPHTAAMSAAPRIADDDINQPDTPHEIEARGKLLYNFRCNETAMTRRAHLRGHTNPVTRARPSSLRRRRFQRRATRARPPPPSWPRRQLLARHRWPPPRWHRALPLSVRRA